MKATHPNNLYGKKWFAMRRAGFAIVAVLLTLAGCEGSNSPAEPRPGDGLSAPTPPGLRRQLSMVSGNGQRGRVGEVLRDPLVVRVTGEGGKPLAGIFVWWTPVEGEGQIPGPKVNRDGQPGEATVLATDADGLSRADLILGSRPGRQVVEAITLFSKERIVFVATAE